MHSCENVEPARCKKNILLSIAQTLSLTKPRLSIFLFHWPFSWPLLMLRFWPCKQPHCEDTENSKTLILQKVMHKLRVYCGCAGSRAAHRGLFFLSVQSKAEGRKAAEPGPILRGWVVARTSPPTVQIWKPSQLCHFRQSQWKLLCNTQWENSYN